MPRSDRYFVKRNTLIKKRDRLKKKLEIAEQEFKMMTDDILTEVEEFKRLCNSIAERIDDIDGVIQKRDAEFNNLGRLKSTSSLNSLLAADAWQLP